MLVFDEAGQVQCRKMRRFGCQDSAIYFSGSVELTRLMQLKPCSIDWSGRNGRAVACFAMPSLPARWLARSKVGQDG